jgi:acetoin utilization deacetylase AcuC-like enzyme
MLIFHDANHGAHAGRHEMFRGRLVPYHEVPRRAELAVNELARRGFGPWLEARPADRATLETVHSTRYLDFLEGAWNEWVALDPAHAQIDILPSVWPNHELRRDVLPANFSAKVGLFAFDAGTPITAGTWQVARSAAGCAVEAARRVASGEDRCAMAVTRPPGHHAGRDFYGGYCFINGSAMAAQALRDAGHAKVAVLDVDYHHGNGTQAIFYERSDVLTVSIHGDPMTEYPFYLGHADERGRSEGEGFNLNLPLPRGTAFAAWRAALNTGLEAVARFGATALVVPLGVDTYCKDPISSFALESPDFIEVGRMLASLRLPTVMVLEGGYAVDDMGVNVANVAQGFALG